MNALKSHVLERGDLFESLFLRVGVLVRPFLESEEFLLARKILTGNENRLACCRWVYDGVGDLLVERINAVLF